MNKFIHRVLYENGVVKEEDYLTDTGRKWKHAGAGILHACCGALPPWPLKPEHLNLGTCTPPCVRMVVARQRIITFHNEFSSFDSGCTVQETCRGG